MIAASKVKIIHCGLRNTSRNEVCCRCSSCTERTDEKKNASKQTSRLSVSESTPYTAKHSKIQAMLPAAFLPLKKTFTARATRCCKGLGGGQIRRRPRTAAEPAETVGRREVPGSSAYKTPDAWQGSRRAVALTESPCSRRGGRVNRC